LNIVQSETKHRVSNSLIRAAMRWMRAPALGHGLTLRILDRRGACGAIIGQGLLLRPSFAYRSRAQVETADWRVLFNEWAETLSAFHTVDRTMEIQHEIEARDVCVRRPARWLVRLGVLLLALTRGMPMKKRKTLAMALSCPRIVVRPGQVSVGEIRSRALARRGVRVHVLRSGPRCDLAAQRVEPADEASAIPA